MEFLSFHGYDISIGEGEQEVFNQSLNQRIKSKFKPSKNEDLIIKVDTLGYRTYPNPILSYPTRTPYPILSYHLTQTPPSYHPIPFIPKPMVKILRSA